MPKRVVLCTWSLPGLGWAYALASQAMMNFRCIFQKRKKRRRRRRSYSRGHKKVSTNFSFAYIQVFNDAAAAAPRFAALPRRLMRASKCQKLHYHEQCYGVYVYSIQDGWRLVDCKVQCQNHKENGANFCGPLRKAELYRQGTILAIVATLQQKCDKICIQGHITC